MDFEAVSPNFAQKIEILKQNLTFLSANLRNKRAHKFILAVSGGGDSLAMAQIIHEIKPQNMEFQCVIISHNIAHNSLEIAQNALKKCEEIGLDAIILNVEEKIIAPLQENARKARYRLLCEYCQKIGANGIFLAHNYDDQIETMIFRLLRKTDIFGLRGMAQYQTSIEYGVKSLFIRPFMDFSREELRNFLKIRQITYFDDPANENTNFSRVKIRKSIMTLNINKDKMIKTAQNAAKLRAIADKIAFELLSENYINEGNRISISREKFLQYPNFIGEYILIKAIMAIGENKYPPSPQKIKNLYENIKQENFKGQSLGGVKLFKKHENLNLELAPLRKNSSNSGKTENSLQFAAKIAAICNQWEGFLVH